MLKIGSINSSALEKVTEFYQLASQVTLNNVFHNGVFFRGLQLEIHFSCLLLNFLLYKTKMGII